MPARTTMEDLQTHLFAQLERLGDESLQGEDLDQEIRRTEAVTQVSGQILEGYRVHVDAAKVQVAAVNAGVATPGLPKMIAAKASAE